MKVRTVRVSKSDIYRLAAEVRCDWRTVLGALQGGGSASTRHAVSEAASKLGIDIDSPGVETRESKAS